MRIEKAVSRGTATALAAALILVCTSVPARGIEPKQGSPLGDRAFQIDQLDIETAFATPVGLPADARTPALDDLAAIGVPPAAGHLDLRGGRWAGLRPATPLVPGAGVGNELSWQALGFAPPADAAALRGAVGQAFRAYLTSHAAALRLNLAELPDVARITVHEGGRIAQIHQPRVVDGVPVRGSYLSAVVNSGNLILLGVERWGDIDVATRPSILAEVAIGAVAEHGQPLALTGLWDKTELQIVPMASGRATPGRLGEGYTHRLVWAVRASFAGDMGRWEGLVDAHSGELISFQDTNQYADVKGGVLPVSNDGLVPDGVEQPGWPMPFQDISTSSGTQTTDTGGNVAASGSMTATFFGPYIDINDNCGAASLTQSDGIDWGVSGGTDCVTPGFGGAGNTHASRTGFYELNKIIEMARGQLPGNSWLQSRLISNMNINNTCNAFWNGTVNFYRSGGGCSNTGELAGVFDHEWGHGMDANDATPGISSPSGEGIADVYTALRLNSSCIGRNFRPGVNCSGNGDPCLNCTGVRDIDYLKRQSGQPHGYSWSNANCGGSVHCIGGVYSEAVWSLWKRELQQAPYSYDNDTAWEIVNRLTFIGAGATGTWFSGGPPNGGCADSSGYMNYLAADDDNGNLNDGTPHMTAIFTAFNDQEIACQTPTVQDSGCAGTPSAAPAVTTSNGNTLVGLTWTSVPGATEYEVFRTEGVFQCDFGKVKLGSTTGTSWNDSGLQNGRDYSYVVIPKGPADSCFGPASACATEAPVGQPDFSVSCGPSSFAIAQGDSDTSTCTVLSSFGYTGTVALSCAGNPPGVSCSFSPSSVSPPADGSAASTLTLTVSAGQPTGTFGFDVEGDDGAMTRSSALSVQVLPAGSNGPQTAVYDAGLGAPKCSVAGSSCDSVGLLDGRDGNGPEPNAPNTLDGCADGTSGTYHSDESNDRIVVSTLDGGNFTEGDTVEIEATVWAWSTGSSDTLDLYYTADANNPSWVYITSIVPPGGGARTLSAQYTLPAGSMQAVRANFRYQGSASPCSGGTYDDADDLVFTVESAAGCTVDADCDDGAFCNGAETCNTGTGQCEAGTPPTCDDGLFCNGLEICDDTADACAPGTPPACDDGLFCNGLETCNEAADDCDPGTPPACDDNVFCNGAETCNESTNGCDPGTPPSCDDGVLCTDDSCNTGTDSCDNVPNDGLCNDGLFCNGVETCDAVFDCVAGSDPCPGQSCDEQADVCTSSCLPKRASCTLDSECCSGKCRGKAGNKSCK